MRVLNFYGVSSCLVPVVDAELPFKEVNAELANNRIVFFDGLPPAAEDIYQLNNYDELITAYGDKRVLEYSGITLSYTQDNSKLKRVIHKAPDVLESVYLNDTTEGIGWFALVMFEPSPMSGYSALVFSDSIGTHESEAKFITLDSLTGLATNPNWLRDVSLILTEISDMEA